MAIAPQDLHDAVFARKLNLLNSLLFEVLVRSQKMLVLQCRQLFLELDVLLVVAPQLRIVIDERANQLFFMFFHDETPWRVRGCSSSPPTPCQFFHTHL